MAGPSSGKGRNDMATTLYTPTRVTLGKGAEDSLGEELKRNGAKKVLIHYGSERIVRDGLMKRLTDQMDREGIEYVLLGGAQPNPRLSLVRKGIELSRNEGVDFIVAAGGGSAIDSAKAIAYGLYDKDGDVWDFYTGARKPQGAYPIGVILTLSATGSEMSDSSVITNEDGDLKRGVNSDYARPRFALLDPELTYTVPPYQTSCGTADMMMHTIERFFHSGPSLELTDNLAIALLRTVAENGIKALQNPQDYEARKNLMWASSLSHNGLMQEGNAQRGDWACHQMEHELSGLFDVAHGAGLTAIWGTWARYVYLEDPERFAKLGEGVFGTKRTGSPERDAEAAIKAFEEYFRAIHMPTSIRDLGVRPTEKQIDEMAEKAVFWGKRTLGAFKVLGKEDIAKIYTEASK